MSEQPCPTCQGARLRSEAIAVTVGDAKLPHVSRMSIAEAYAWVERLYGGFGDSSASDQSDDSALTGEQFEIAGEVLKEIRDRLRFMLNVGLRLPHARPPRAHALRRRGPAHPPGEPDRLAASSACSTSSTSPPSACTPATTAR